MKLVEEGIWRSKYPENTQKQEKTIQHKVLVEATKEHPAQVERWAENRTVGTYTLKKVCGMISPAEKSKYLGRIDSLIRATKKARQRANATSLVKRKVGTTLFNFILEG